MKPTVLSALAAVMLAMASPASAQHAVRVLAAENVYGDVAAQIGGPDVQVTSVLSNPAQDPHLFEVSPSVARDVAGAAIVIANGAEYDPWIGKLLGASAGRGPREVIVVADIARKSAGDNPHVWYDPTVMVGFARVLATDLSRVDPSHRTEYALRELAFEASLAPVQAQIAILRARFGGQSVTATEPVFGYMAASLGLVMRNERFQRAVMNNAEPSASDVAAFEDDLRQHRARALIYNSQATDEQATRLMHLAEQAHVPVVGVTETEPPGTTYQGWMGGQLDALERALAQATR